ncbi:MAG: hypothetical protein AAFO69_17090 [Bacteroidota bacterium]
MRIFIFFLSFSVTALHSLPVYSQLTGHVNYEQIGIEFDIPAGWVGQEQEDMIVLNSNNSRGIIMMTTHEYSIQELIAESKKEINEAGGTSLKLVGKTELLNENAIAGEYTGTMEWQPVKAFVIGIANPHESGIGVTLLSVAQQSDFDATNIALCKQLYRSVSFKKVDNSAALLEWKEWLGNCRLTYMDSYSSSSVVSGGMSGGYSSKTTIDLCAKGYFNFNSQSDLSVGNSGASTYGSSAVQGQGEWNVITNVDGSFLLELSFHTGEKSTYRISYEDSKFHLNNNRYFVTRDGEYAPDCE